MTAIAVDDAVADPRAWRREALAARYRRPHPHYPWFVSWAPCRLVDEAVAVVEAAVGERLYDTGPGPAGSTVARFHACCEGATPLISAHTDPYQWAAVLFLTPGPPARSGLRLLRRRSTGATGRPGGDDEAALHVGTPLDVAYDLDEFDTTEVVDNEFNRMVVFDAARYHAAQGYFGRDLLTARLTVTLFGNTGRPRRSTLPAGVFEGRS